MPLYRERMVVKGRVQGVGFRYFTTMTADDFAVSGFVRNMPDGSVEVVAEGARDEVDKFLAKVRRGPSHARVDEVKSFVEEATGEYAGFGVKY